MPWGGGGWQVTAEHLHQAAQIHAEQTEALFELDGRICQDTIVAE